MKVFKKFLEINDKLETFILCGSTIAFTVIIFFNVITRYFFNYSWAPTEEVVRFIRIFVAFFGASYAARYGLHINMSVIYDMLPSVGKKVFMLIISSVSCVASFLLTVYGYQMAMGAYYGQQVSPALRWPLAPIYMALPLGCFLMGIQYARTFIKNIQKEGVYIGPEVRKDIEEASNP